MSTWPAAPACPPEPDQVEVLRRTLLAGRARHQQPAVHILEPIGQGSFARVYKGACAAASAFRTLRQLAPHDIIVCL